MTSSNPTPDDLRTIAENMKAEGQTSRAEVLVNAAQRMERLEGYLNQFREIVKESAASIYTDVDELVREFDLLGRNEK